MKAEYRAQSTEYRVQRKAQRCLVYFLLIFIHCLLFASGAYAKEVTILYTGETHAMLYACSCPIQTDGGVARRASLVKQLRQQNPDAMLLDSGGFFGGGLQDEYTQSSELDIERTKINLKAMELMRYDAACVGDDEFNFGKDVFEKAIDGSKISFLSANIQARNVLPYAIKDISGVKFGLIGLTSPVAQQKALNLQFTPSKQALQSTVNELKSKGANFIILLSHLGENEDTRLLGEVSGIDIIIVGHSRDKEEQFTRIGSTLMLRPSWQGRRMGKVSLFIKDNKITDYKAEELRLSDKIQDDPDVKKFLPQCFSDSNCRKPGLSGICRNPAAIAASCSFKEPEKVGLLVLSVKNCPTCKTEQIIGSLKKQLPGLSVSYLYYPENKAQQLIKEFGLRGLPAYLLGKEAEKEDNFEGLKSKFVASGSYYVLSPQFSGISYFPGRAAMPGKLDLFLSLFDQNTPGLLEGLKDLNPEIHFLVAEQDGKFDAKYGNLEIEDTLRAVCVKKYYPQYFSGYVSCRSKNIGSSWWEDCLGDFSAEKIKACARSEEGKALLEQNIALSKELEIMFGPAYLINNQEILSSKGVPAKEELRKLIKR